MLRRMEARNSALTDEVGRLSITRVQRASDQIALQLRALVLSGELQPGTRLPTEQQLAAQFGVSRATIREALNAMSTEGMIRSKKGVKGGNFVVTPSPGVIGDKLASGVALLSRSNDIRLEDLLEVREMLEVPASAFAAIRRTDEDLIELRAAIPGEPGDLSLGEQFSHNRAFHQILVGCAHNMLLEISARPIYILQTRLHREVLGGEFHTTINVHHRMIADAIADRDADRARELMREHLAWLRPWHQRIWGDDAPALAEHLPLPTRA